MRRRRTSPQEIPGAHIYELISPRFSQANAVTGTCIRYRSQKRRRSTDPICHALQTERTWPGAAMWLWSRSIAGSMRSGSPIWVSGDVQSDELELRGRRCIGAPASSRRPGVWIFAQRREVASDWSRIAAREDSPGRQPGVFSCLEAERRRRDTVTESAAPMGLDLSTTSVPGLTPGAKL